MVILTTIRQSPAYLYVKTYCLCVMVTLFQAAPVSSRLPRVGETLQLNKYRIISTRLGPRIVPADTSETTKPGSKNIEDDHKEKEVKPAAAKQLIISPELIGPWAKESRVRTILSRWYQRAVDLSQVKRLLRRDDTDVRAYPELEWDAAVRRSSALHIQERRFIALRKHRISSQGADSLRHFLDLPPSEKVDPRDVPLIALGGSGGGYRTMYGLTAFIAASKKLGLWDCISWVAGVSGSCWTLAAYYTIAYQDVARLTQHYLSMAKELAHPMSVLALNTVARSSKGVYFLIGPLVRKAQNNIIGLSVMDLYATLTTTYQFISREPRARLSRATFQFSKVWTRSGIDKGLEPMPILTAVRRAPKDSSGVKPHTDSSISKGQPPESALAQHHHQVTDAIMSRRPRKLERSESMTIPGFFQWFEISPLEVGSPDAHGYIPTWAWGRTFAAGQSVGRQPEQSLSLMLGQCTSAPAGPLTGYIDALLATMPKGTIMSRVLLLVNNFIRMKKLARLWGNPIRAGHDPNPFYGLNSRPSPKNIHGDTNVIGIGVSSFDSSRLDRMVSRMGPSAEEAIAGFDKLARRILSKQELDEYESLKSGGENAEERTQAVKAHLATVWALKAASFKALHSAYSLSWRDIIITSAPDTSSRQENKQDLDILRISLSSEWLSRVGDSHIPVFRPVIAQHGNMFIANVVAEEGPIIPPANQADLLQAEKDADPIAESPNNDSLAQNTSSQEVNSGSAKPDSPSQKPHPPWESHGRVRLMDSGMSNNLPNHILARPERGADLIIAFDASSDVQLGSAIRRLQNFAEDCNLELEELTDLFDPVQPCFDSAGDESPAHKIENQFLEQYSRVFRGLRPTGEEVYIVYCPLLPNGSNPSFDPSVSLALLS